MLLFCTLLLGNFSGQKEPNVSPIKWGHKWGVQYLMPFPHHHHHHHRPHSLAADPAFFQWHGHGAAAAAVNEEDDDDEHERRAVRCAACARNFSFFMPEGV